MTLHLETKPALPPITDNALFYIVVLTCVDGTIRIVTSAEKAKQKISEQPNFFIKWAYHIVE